MEDNSVAKPSPAYQEAARFYQAGRTNRVWQRLAEEEQLMETLSKMDSISVEEKFIIKRGPETYVVGNKRKRKLPEEMDKDVDMESSKDIKADQGRSIASRSKTNSKNSRDEKASIQVMDVDTKPVHPKSADKAVLSGDKPTSLYTPFQGDKRSAPTSGRAIVDYSDIAGDDLFQF